jgi:hypothetical protein
MVRDDNLRPRVFYRLTDNWVELSVRFLVEADRVRVVKDAMSREILNALAAAGLSIASTTYEIVGLPTVRIARAREDHATHGSEA